METLLLVGAAACVGVVVGLTGMGGGALMTPMLVLGFGVPAPVAVSSDIVAAPAMKLTGSGVHASRGTVHWTLVKWLVIGAVPTAAIGAFIAYEIADPTVLAKTLKTLIGVVLLLAAAGLIMRAYIRLRERARTLDGSAFPLPHSTERPVVKPRVALTVLLGAIGGLLVGLTSVGSGSLMIVALMALYPALRAPQLVGTDLAQAVPLVIAAAASHIVFGDVNWTYVGLVVLGSVPGTLLGAQLASRVSGGVVRRALALVLLLAGLSMLGLPPAWIAAAVILAVVTGTIAWALLRRHYGFPIFVRKSRQEVPDESAHEARLTRLQVHELELVRAGAFASGARYGPPDDLDSPSLFVPNPQTGDNLLLLDLESTPVARVTVEGGQRTPEGTWIIGPIETLRPLTQGVFKEIRLGTVDASARESAVLDGDQALSVSFGGKALIILDGDDPARTARRVRWARLQTEDVYVMPEPDLGHLSAPKRKRLLRALATQLLGGKVSIIEGETVKGAGCVVLFTGLSGAGKSTLARSVTHRLQSDDPREVTLLDGDEVRAMVSKGLGFSREDRELNVRRIGWIASLVSRHGGIAVCAPIAPYAASRAEVRDMAEPFGAFVLVHVSTPLNVCEQRDRKGMYAKARAGEILFFTGISDPYEAPTDADITVDTSQENLDDAAERIAKFIRATADTAPRR